MAREQGPMSGFRDMLAEQSLARQDMFNTIQEIYEGYGFTPLKTPALERLSTLTGRYGEEGDKLIYQFEDNGGRAVALRYDQTVPLARVVAQHSSVLPMPYKRYAVGEVWRGESPQAGRYREFTQFDADTVGTTSVAADTEIIAMMSDTMSAIGVNSLIRVNNRRVLDGLAEVAGLSDDEDRMGLIATVDRVEKIGIEATLASIQERFGDRATLVTSSYLAATGAPRDKLHHINVLLGENPAAAEGIANLENVFNILEASGYDANQIAFDQTIARGLDYYTGTIYETSVAGAEELGSVCSGGRFDKLVRDLGGPDLPAVGTSIGVDRLYDVLAKLGKLKARKTPTEVMVINFDSKDDPTKNLGVYVGAATRLRHAGIPAEIEYDPRKIGKQIATADKMGIPYVLLMGPDEIQEGTAKIKDLTSGEQIEVALSGIEQAIHELRQKRQAD